MTAIHIHCRSQNHFVLDSQAVVFQHAWLFWNLIFAFHFLSPKRDRLLPTSIHPAQDDLAYVHFQNSTTKPTNLSHVPPSSTFSITPNPNFRGFQRLGGRPGRMDHRQLLLVIFCQTFRLGIGHILLTWTGMPLMLKHKIEAIVYMVILYHIFVHAFFPLQHTLLLSRDDSSRSPSTSHSH